MSKQVFYKNLLKKYIGIVSYFEGIDYIDRIDAEESYGGISFSEEEIKVLNISYEDVIYDAKFEEFKLLKENKKYILSFLKDPRSVVNEFNQDIDKLKIYFDIDRLTNDEIEKISSIRIDGFTIILDKFT